jgi:hypothetical protein
MVGNRVESEPGARGRCKEAARWPTTDTKPEESTMKRTRRIIAAAALTAALTAAVPAAADAASVRGYKIWDAGSVLKERYKFCIRVPAGREWKVFSHTRVEMDDGTDSRVYTGSDWYSNGCWTVRNSMDDNLEYRGSYYGRLRIRVGPTSETFVTRPWWEFWSS